MLSTQSSEDLLAGKWWPLIHYSNNIEVSLYLRGFVYDLLEELEGNTDWQLLMVIARLLWDLQEKYCSDTIIIQTRKKEEGVYTFFFKC